MKTLKKIYSNKIITMFIVLQPIIDILIYFFKKNFMVPLTFSMVIRIFFLIYTLVYLIIINKTFKKYINFFSILTILIFAINIGYNILLNDSSFIFEEIKNIFKLLYFPYTLLFFFIYNKNSEKKLSLNILVINILILATALIISKFTSTEMCSYSQTINCINGTSGWIYSANELSMILVLLLPVMLYNFFETKYSFSSIMGLVLCIFCILELGTKAPYISLLIILIITFIIQIIISFIKSSKTALKNSGILILIILMIYFITPSVPVCYNNFNLFKSYKIYCKMPIEPTEEILKGNKESIETYVEDQLEKISKEESVETQIFSGREDYLKKFEVYYKKTSNINKFIGLGYENYKENGEVKNILIERDFHDLLFQYGYLSIIIIWLPILFCLIKYIMCIIKNPIEIINTKNIMILGCVIGLGGAYISGHVLFSPSVTIYISYILGLLTSEDLNDFKSDIKNKY